MADLDPLVAYEDDPPGCEVHHPYGAYNQGHDAGTLGHPASSCPYVEERHGRWRRAWLQGHADATGPDEQPEPDPLPPPSTQTRWSTRTHVNR